MPLRDLLKRIEQGLFDNGGKPRPEPLEDDEPLTQDWIEYLQNAPERVLREMCSAGPAPYKETPGLPLGRAPGAILKYGGNMSPRAINELVRAWGISRVLDLFLRPPGVLEDMPAQKAVLATWMVGNLDKIPMLGDDPKRAQNAMVVLGQEGFLRAGTPGLRETVARIVRAAKASSPGTHSAYLTIPGVVGNPDCRVPDPDDTFWGDHIRNVYLAIEALGDEDTPQRKKVMLNALSSSHAQVTGTLGLNALMLAIAHRPDIHQDQEIRAAMKRNLASAIGHDPLIVFILLKTTPSEQLREVLIDETRGDQRGTEWFVQWLETHPEQATMERLLALATHPNQTCRTRTLGIMAKARKNTGPGPGPTKTVLRG